MGSKGHGTFSYSYAASHTHHKCGLASEFGVSGVRYLSRCGFTCPCRKIVARHNVTAAAEIDFACLRTPMQRALIMLLLPALLAVSLVVVVPLSGSFAVDKNPTVNTWVYSLYLEPIYMAWGYWLCISFFYFSTKRFFSVIFEKSPSLITFHIHDCLSTHACQNHTRGACRAVIDT